MKHTVEFELDGKTVSLESGRLAKQAGGSVVVRCGDTQVLVAATSTAEPREGIDFFPLTSSSSMTISRARGLRTIGQRCSTTSTCSNWTAQARPIVWTVSPVESEIR